MHIMVMSSPSLLVSLNALRMYNTWHGAAVLCNANVSKLRSRSARMQELLGSIYNPSSSSNGHYIVDVFGGTRNNPPPHTHTHTHTHPFFLSALRVAAPPRQFQPPNERGERGGFCAILGDKLEIGGCQFLLEGYQFPLWRLKLSWGCSLEEGRPCKKGGILGSH